MTDKKKEGLVKSCYKMESGLRLGQEGIHACQLGPFSSPIYFTEDEASKTKITKKMIMEKRKWIYDLLNDDHSETPCKHCSMVIYKKPEEVRFDELGHMDLAAETTCNLRCNFCGYTHFDSFADAKYDALEILKEFQPEDVTWNSAVDFNGGEPTLLKDFDDYIGYFESRKSRVFLFTNGVIYKQSVYDGLINGTVRWCIVSLDAGTKSTYNKMKKSTKFNQVLENIARYSEAGNMGGGGCSVKYIFHEDNCGDDDINGFSYAMLALRPQEVWLTFDFDPLCDLPADSDDFGGYDYSKHILAYAKTYLMLEKHGLKPVHYAEKHLGPASQHGINLLKMAKEKIETLTLKKKNAESLQLVDFRTNKVDDGESQSYLQFRLSPKLEIKTEDGWKSPNLKGKTIAIAPASPRIKDFLDGITAAGGEVLGIFDLDKVLHGKVIEGVTVYPYTAGEELDPDVVFIANTNPVIERDICLSVGSNAKRADIHVFMHEESSDVDLQDAVLIKSEIDGVQKGEGEYLQWARHTSG